jgi:tellurite resistance protein TerC
VPLAASSRDNFVDIHVTVLAWVVLAVVVVVLLAIDLIRHRDDHAPSTREALLESGFWVACGLLFGAGVAIVYGGDAFGEYVSGYLIEKSLSVDNVFVWAIIFSTMSIPLRFQHRVLFWGIFGALTLRAAFIFLGSALINRFFWLLVVFGLFLVYSGAKIIRHREGENEESSSRGLGLLRRFMHVTDEYDGHRFLTRMNGSLAATPLFAA